MRSFEAWRWSPQTWRSALQKDFLFLDSTLTWWRTKGWSMLVLGSPMSWWFQGTKRWRLSSSWSSWRRPTRWKEQGVWNLMFYSSTHRIHPYPCTSVLIDWIISPFPEPKPIWDLLNPSIHRFSPLPELTGLGQIRACQQESHWSVRLLVSAHQLGS